MDICSCGTLVAVIFEVTSVDVEIYSLMDRSDVLEMVDANVSDVAEFSIVVGTDTVDDDIYVCLVEINVESNDDAPDIDVESSMTVLSAVFSMVLGCK